MRAAHIILPEEILISRFEKRKNRMICSIHLITIIFLDLLLKAEILSLAKPSQPLHICNQSCLKFFDSGRMKAIRDDCVSIVPSGVISTGRVSSYTTYDILCLAYVNYPARIPVSLPDKDIHTIPLYILTGMQLIISELIGFDGVHRLAPHSGNSIINNLHKHKHLAIDTTRFIGLLT